MAGIDPKDKRKLEDLIELLESIKGRHTELVTVLIPAGSNINATTSHIPPRHQPYLSKDLK